MRTVSVNTASSEILLPRANVQASSAPSTIRNEPMYVHWGCRRRGCGASWQTCSSLAASRPAGLATAQKLRIRIAYCNGPTIVRPADCSGGSRFVDKARSLIAPLGGRAVPAAAGAGCNTEQHTVAHRLLGAEAPVDGELGWTLPPTFRRQQFPSLKEGSRHPSLGVTRGRGRVGRLRPCVFVGLCCWLVHGL